MSNAGRARKSVRRSRLASAVETRSLNLGGSGAAAVSALSLNEKEIPLERGSGVGLMNQYWLILMFFRSKLIWRIPSPENFPFIRNLLFIPITHFPIQFDTS
jgi:hypothetical protein